MAAKTKDLSFANDEQASRTVMLDLEDSEQAPLLDTVDRVIAVEEPTVVLDLTATQVHDLLTNPDTILRRPVKK